ncbi:GspH/FimT family pseudopilin [Pseudoxanthomonas sp.]|uniref:GspH/FimT family pseudopilin n=1 Tax=Pseudoxanthomonas sp. TaxID=1871049 RepID=UPI002628F9BA|nr:GspH/FimT family pseudopilin [Pseudoxanthomonas sp.]WDS38094.1 MAG: GspH/FimT family pseudopilin [Pseudoxanthomonas sp.]
MMVAIAVLAIMLAIAVPSFSQLLASNRLTAQANELVAALQVARSEAIRRNARVILCPSSDGASCATAATSWTKWIVQVVKTAEVLRVNDVNTAVTVLASDRITGNDNGVTFRADGLARDATSSLLVANVSVCMTNTRLEQNRRLVGIASGSRVSVTSDADSGCEAPANE